MYRMIRPRWHNPPPNEVTKRTELEYHKRPGRPQVSTAVVRNVGVRGKGTLDRRALVQSGLELSRPGVATEMVVHPRGNDIHDPIAQGGGIELPSYVPQVSEGQHRPQGSDSSNVRTEVDRVAVRLHEGLAHDER
ncbi:hypothetical protein PR002_g12857 [Phytophthora rubi]|uniref:Uncharacterized protein n=1 Tax=Phytophthora rubi TaxID=129364 RepID=A0A6A3LIR3_9STRA|nr:hypothetical protein PR002_g12857 [Phytophthora rubi]